MSIGAQSVPMRWPGRSLGHCKRQKGKNFHARDRRVLRQWQDPSLLAWCRARPFNCLSSAGLRVPEDAEQQQALKPLIEKGRQAGLSFVGLVERPGGQGSRSGGRPVGGPFRCRHGSCSNGECRHSGCCLAKSATHFWGANFPDPRRGGRPLARSSTERLRPAVRRTCLGWIPTSVGSPMAQARAPDRPCGSVVDPPQKAKTHDRELPGCHSGPERRRRWLISWMTRCGAGWREERLVGGKLEESHRRRDFLRAKTRHPGLRRMVGWRDVGLFGAGPGFRRGRAEPAARLREPFSGGS